MLKGYIMTEAGLVPRDSFQAGGPAAPPAEAQGGRLAAGRALSRRDFLAAGGKALFTLSVLSTVAGLAKKGLAATAPSPWEIPGLSSEVTPTREFYRVDKNFWVPVVEPRSWLLQVDGLVHRPYALDYNQLTSGGPLVSQYVTLTCISNEVGGHLAGNALWRGVRLRDVLQQAGVMEGAVDLVMEAHDQYTDSIPIAKAMHPDTLLVWEMNGEPLTAEHGAPARIIVPGIYGMKNVKWVTRLTVVDYDYQGFWERRGWSDTARIKTWSRFDVPRPGTVRRGDTVVLGGVALAGDRGVSAVEYSVDGGRTWRPAQVKESLSQSAWRLWKAQWQPEATGSARLLVRAVDGEGTVQTDEAAAPYPDGSSGYHALRVNVRA